MRDRAAAEAVEERAAALGAALGAHILPGKMVVEAAVLPSGKAGALARLKAQTRADRMVFAGDDVTDELALKTIKPPDLGIKVGPGPSAAALHLDGPPEMARFLTALAAALPAL
jgi:trehalose 6-phosphate phosphatase